MNTFGNNLRLTTFGESHGPAIGGVIDGFPPGFKIDFDSLYKEIAKRRPGGSKLATQRNESDSPEFLSGITPEGVTLGTPIGFIIRNSDTRSSDYSEVKDKYRPNHADFTYDFRYGIRDWRGGGRASARETANWVVAGALAQQWLESKDIKIRTLLSGAGQVSYVEKIKAMLAIYPHSLSDFTLPDEANILIEEEISKAKNDGDSIGGSVSCLISGLNAGVGNPVFDKLHSRLAFAMMSINAAKGFDYGIGFDAVEKKGSQVVDSFAAQDGRVETLSNFSGGIQGGISNGMPIYFTVYFKPTPTIMRELQTINKDGTLVALKMKGRHDPCVALRAVAVVKAMAALTIADFLL